MSPEALQVYFPQCTAEVEPRSCSRSSKAARERRLCQDPPSNSLYQRGAFSFFFFPFILFFSKRQIVAVSVRHPESCGVAALVSLWLLRSERRRAATQSQAQQPKSQQLCAEGRPGDSGNQPIRAAS